MNNIPGITILNQTSEFIKVPTEKWQWNIFSVLFVILLIILLIGGSALFGYFLIKRKIGAFILSFCIISLLIAWTSQYALQNGLEWQNKEIITYTVTLNETTPFLNLQNYEFIKVENGVYTFKEYKNE